MTSAVFWRYWWPRWRVKVDGETLVNQRADPNKDVRHARPVQCGGDYHKAACVSVIVHLRLFRFVSWIEGKGWNEDGDIIRPSYKTHATHFIPLTH